MTKSNPPAGKVWRKGYTRANGTRVKGTWVRKNPSRKRTARRAAPRSNPRRKAKRKRTTRKRRNMVYRGRNNPRTRTRTVVKYRYRNPRAKAPARRRTRRNPATANTSAFQGKWSLKKAVKVVSMNEFLFGGAGLLASSLGPAYIGTSTGKDFTSGHRDWLWSGAIALVGGTFIGRSFGAREGRAWAIAGAAVTAVKMLRAFTGGQFNLPLVGAQHGQAQSVSLDSALANASYTGYNLGAVEEVYPGQINKFYTPALDSPFVVQTT